MRLLRVMVCFGAHNKFVALGVLMVKFCMVFGISILAVGISNKSGIGTQSTNFTAFNPYLVVLRLRDLHYLARDVISHLNQ